MKQNKGFTLIEVLIAFSIFLILASLFPQFIKLISYEAKSIHHLETSIFFQQLSSDVQKSANIYVENNTLYLLQGNNDVVTYGYFQKRIRRQVNNKGQEMVLQNVADVTFSSWVNGIDVLILDLYNQIHQKRITHLISLEVMKSE
ncbi:competence type IV pilus minor pilin ComGF [Anaerobacillus isosaccharinicus]|uniref:Prepilin-type N-terminal cleavage/methylation domain-containing protein n=1 Tax=Anaerobacillus isosaccharinicus TaxID=1532552 RepID=A0A1S2M2R0_9BACI|nr:competence type IV pilus minor pilin ComGF [Anaerobacillus isosaccharinicus]MBA5585587.1 prepilin-type N-terminal cleavage/methylation domain-containing protein [Anaerobacillus isosaccharinicus]QOY36100.1 prepilin-type N-terminal cleavage/methylation domain-containing protein [Anaerobacillus isosaccharinicus]